MSNNANQISQIASLNETKDFAYDNVNRLLNVNTSDESYGYDSVGNRTTSHLTSTYNYQPFNRLSSADSSSYVYDLNGNMTSRFIPATGDTWTYNWDFENRMKSATNGGETISFRYDALGRRVRRTKGSKVTKYIYDGQDVVLDDDNFEGITKYVNGLGIDNKLKMTDNIGTERYFLQDHLGSTVAMTEVDGSYKYEASYDAFGNDSKNELPTRYKFTGREYDEDLGLQYSRARWYSSELGRFISEDPIGFAGGDVNLFGYVGNNPQQFVDPSGNQRSAERWDKNEVERGRDLQQYVQRMPNPVDTGRFERLVQCHQRNKFSSLFSEIPYGEGTVEVVETGSLLSLGGDAVATARKLGHGTASANPYGSGINMVTKDINRAIGFPRIGGTPLGKYLTPIGNKLTPPLAVFGAFTFSYNTTIDIQCICGQIE